MTGRTAPSKPSPIHALMLAQAKRMACTGYGLQKSTGMSLRTVQRFLAAEGSPTLATVEAMAKALGLEIDVRKADR